MARERGLDLVEISPTADPPVCKITDYGKFLYQLNKKAHEQRKHQKGTQLKEVKFRPATAEHDYQVRKNQIIRFLGEGHKVKAMIFHRGREMAHQEVGRAKMDRLLKDITEHALVELGPRMEANILMALLAPKKGGVRAVRGPRSAGAAPERSLAPRKEKRTLVPRNRSKSKLKLKTHRGAAKRFKITANGKVLRMHSGKRHLMGTKKPKRMRHLKKLEVIDDVNTSAMLPYG